MYQKEIIYLGLYKNGDRVGSAGFLKAEQRDRESRLYLKVQNIPLGISGRFPVRVYNGSDWKEINGLTIRDGGGIWQENLAGNSNKTMIQVMLSGGYMLEGKGKSVPETVSGENENVPRESSEKNAFPEEPDGETPVNADIRQNLNIPERTEIQKDVPKQTEIQKDVPEQTEVRKDTPEQTEVWKDTPEQVKLNEDIPERTKINEEKVLVTEELSPRPVEDADSMTQSIPNYNLKEDKWEQILDTYENIRPYGDERVYVKLEPKDFVILQSKYQHLVNNSFLLHGFYNYRYIILGKEKGYYLGVPGVFYEREKMVAQMFGFEAFECPGGNVRAGEFGYYLRKVEL